MLHLYVTVAELVTLFYMRHVNNGMHIFILSTRYQIKRKWGTSVDYTVNENALCLYDIVYTFGKSSDLNTTPNRKHFLFSLFKHFHLDGKKSLGRKAPFAHRSIWDLWSSLGVNTRCSCCFPKQLPILHLDLLRPLIHTFLLINIDRQNVTNNTRKAVSRTTLCQLVHVVSWNKIQSSDMEFIDLIVELLVAAKASKSKPNLHLSIFPAFGMSHFFHRTSIPTSHPPTHQRKRT